MYRDVVLADRPAFVWPLDEAAGTTARDISGNARHATYSGGPTLGGGSARPSSRSPLFAANQWVEASASFQLSGGGRPVAVEAWFLKVAHLGGYPGDINSVVGDLVSVSNGVLLRFNGATTLTAVIAAGDHYVTLSASWPLRLVTHAVIAAEPGKMARLILNGRVVAETAIGSVSGWNLAPRVARSEDGRYFNGAVGWAAAYDAAPFTVAQARRHYEAGRDIVPRFRQQLR